MNKGLNAQTRFSFKYACLERILSNDGRILTVLKPEFISAALKSRSGLPLVLGVFQSDYFPKTRFSRPKSALPEESEQNFKDDERKRRDNLIKNIEDQSQEVYTSITGARDMIPAGLICIIFPNNKIQENLIKSLLTFPFDYSEFNRLRLMTISKIDFSKKPEIEFNNLLTASAVNHSAPEGNYNHIKNVADRISSIKKNYGLTRTEAIMHYAFNQAAARVDEYRTNKVLTERHMAFATKLNIFFASVCSYKFVFDQDKSQSPA